MFYVCRWSTYKFVRPAFDPVSPQAKDFIAKLLERKVDQRLTAAQALKHPWISDLGAIESGSGGSSRREHALSPDVSYLVYWPFYVHAVELSRSILSTILQ